MRKGFADVSLICVWLVFIYHELGQEHMTVIYLNIQNKVVHISNANNIFISFKLVTVLAYLRCAK